LGEDFPHPLDHGCALEWRARSISCTPRSASQPAIAANFAFAMQPGAGLQTRGDAGPGPGSSTPSLAIFNGIGRVHSRAAPFDTAAWLTQAKRGPDDLARLQADFRSADLFSCRTFRLTTRIPAASGAGDGNAGPDFARPVEGQKITDPPN